MLTDPVPLLLQATDRSPKALKYRAPDGSLIQFKEVRACASMRNSTAFSLLCNCNFTRPHLTIRAGAAASSQAGYIYCITLA